MLERDSYDVGNTFSEAKAWLYHTRLLKYAPKCASAVPPVATHIAILSSFRFFCTCKSFNWLTALWKFLECQLNSQSINQSVADYR